MGLVIFIVLFLIMVSAVLVILSLIGRPLPEVNSFEECAALYPVLESYPRQCNTPDGKHFVEDVELPPLPDGIEPQE